jgi:thioredoxin-like negative regulator of GroEL
MTPVTDNTLDATLSAHRVVFIMLRQENCPPCHAMTARGPRGEPSIMEQVAEQHPDIMFRPADYHKNKRLQMRCQVHVTPAMLLFKDGAFLGKWKGPLPADRLSAWIKRTVG